MRDGNNSTGDHGPRKRPANAVVEVADNDLTRVHSLSQLRLKRRLRKRVFAWSWDQAA